MASADDPFVGVLVSSAGRRGALINALRDGADLVGTKYRIVATDLSPLSSAGHLADRFELVPPVASDEYIEATLDIVARNGLTVVIPTIDTELAVLAANRSRFDDDGAYSLAPDSATIEICSDKAKSSRWLSDNGFAVPRQYLQSELAELPSASWPLFFKPLQGSSSIGAHPVANLGEVTLAIERFGPGVVEELVVGDEYTMDCWVDRSGACRAVVPRLRLATRAGEIAKGVTVKNPALEAEVAAIAQALPGARGTITVQAILTDDGPRYIEINPRFGGGYPLSHRAGARFTAALMAEALDRPIDEEWLDWKQDIVMLRYDEAVFLTKQEIDDVRNVR